LGADFLNRFEEAMRRIALFPESGPTAFLDYRRILVRRFPYGVFHVIEGNLLVVAAVYHLARSPETMRRELKP
jgi:toxin ParE1/3/4